MLDKAAVVEAMPPHLQSSVTDDLVNKVNAISIDPEAAEIIRNNFLSYAIVMREGKFKTEDYLNAVAYCSFKIMGYNNAEAYSKTFPMRHAKLLANGASKKDISSYVAAYNKGKLVNLIMEQTLIPAWVLNQDIFQKAIETQAELMLYANSEKVRSDAANSILTHLKKPETKTVDLNITTKESSGMTELKDMLSALAERQLEAIESGVTTREIAHQALAPAPKITPDVIDAELVPEGPSDAEEDDFPTDEESSENDAITNHDRTEPGSNSSPKRFFS